MTASAAMTELVIADLDGRHGHLEDFEPVPLCAGRLAELLPIEHRYVFEDAPTV